MDEKGYSYDKRPIKEENPSREELADWWQKSGQPLKKFFNTRTTKNICPIELLA